jgi:hypothetical protein
VAQAVYGRTSTATAAARCIAGLTGRPDEPSRLGALVRCVFGNPCRPVAHDPSGLAITVLALARHMYDSRDFSAMPILADALQDAGCDNPDVLAHCRGGGPHVRGDEVVDLLFGKG